MKYKNVSTPLMHLMKKYRIELQPPGGSGGGKGGGEGGGEVSNSIDFCLKVPLTVIQFERSGSDTCC